MDFEHTLSEITQSQKEKNACSPSYAGHMYKHIHRDTDIHTHRHLHAETHTEMYTYI